MVHEVNNVHCWIAFRCNTLMELQAKHNILNAMQLFLVNVIRVAADYNREMVRPVYRTLFIFMVAFSL